MALPNQLQTKEQNLKSRNFGPPRSQALLRQFPSIMRISELNTGYLSRSKNKSPYLFPSSWNVLVATDWGDAGNRIGAYLLNYSGHFASPWVSDFVRITITNLCHSLPPFDIRAASLFWESNLSLLQGNTIAICVVDPGVGGERRPIIAKAANGCYLIGPDNGCFDLALRSLNQAAGIEGAWAIRYGSPHIVSPSEGRVETVDGNFVFPAAAAAMACQVPFSEFSDKVSVSELGERLDWKDARIEKGRIIGRIDGIDEPYGTFVTNIPPELLGQIGASPGKSVLLIAGKESKAELTLRLETHFAAVPQGSPLATFHGNTFLHIAINQGKASDSTGFRIGEEIEVKTVE